MKLSEVLDAIRKQVGEENLTNSCSSDGCRVDMTDVPREERIVVDVERVFQVNQKKGKRCDRMLLYVDRTRSKLVVVLIELKSGNVDATEVFQQLQSGAKFAEELVPEDIETTCIPVVFHGKRIHDAQLPKLKRNEVRFRRQTFPVWKRKCGRRTKNLASVLKLALT